MGNACGAGSSGAVREQRAMGLFASASETPTSGAATEATPAAEAPAAATTA